MNNQWLEAMGLRSEIDTIITENLLEALSWLGDRSGQSTLAEEMMAHLIAEEQRQKGK